MTRKGLAIWLLLAVGVSGCISPEARRQRSLTAAEEAAANGDLGRAVEVLRLALDYDPRDPVVATRLALVYEELGDFNRARRVVEKFAGRVEEPSWLNLRARSLFRYGRYQEAVRISVALERAAEVEADTVRTISDIVVERKMKPESTGDLPAVWIPGIVDRLLGGYDPVTALFWLEQIPAEDPARERLLGPFLEHAVESHDSEVVNRVWSLVEPAETAEEILVERRLLVLEGRRSDVAQLDTRFLSDYSDHPRRGEILVAESRRRLAQGDAEGALRQVDEALTLDGCDVPALVLKGLVLQWTGRTEEAEIALRTALAFDPNNQMARQALQTKHEELGAVIMRLESLQP